VARLASGSERVALMPRRHSTSSATWDEAKNERKPKKVSTNSEEHNMFLGTIGLKQPYLVLTW